MKSLHRAVDLTSSSLCLILSPLWIDVERSLINDQWRSVSSRNEITFSFFFLFYLKLVNATLLIMLHQTHSANVSTALSTCAEGGFSQRWRNPQEPPGAAMKGFEIRLEKMWAFPRIFLISEQPFNSDIVRYADCKLRLIPQYTGPKVITI